MARLLFLQALFLLAITTTTTLALPVPQLPPSPREEGPTIMTGHTNITASFPHINTTASSSPTPPPTTIPSVCIHTNDGGGVVTRCEGLDLGPPKNKAEAPLRVRVAAPPRPPRKGLPPGRPLPLCDLDTPLDKWFHEFMGMCRKPPKPRKPLKPHKSKIPFIVGLPGDAAKYDKERARWRKEMDEDDEVKMAFWRKRLQWLVPIIKKHREKKQRKQEKQRKHKEKEQQKHKEKEQEKQRKHKEKEQEKQEEQEQEKRGQGRIMSRGSAKSRR